MSRIATVAVILFLSGLSALAYQSTWFRELRHVFGGTSASSAAVLAVFMGGLGLGNAWLGKRMDALRRPLRAYGYLELGVLISAAVSPLLIEVIDVCYVLIGGQQTLGFWGATVTRLLLTVVVLGVPSFLMGGTLPAVVASATGTEDRSRMITAILYALNSLGAVCGVIVSTFLLLPNFGNRYSLWIACGINLVAALLALLNSSRYQKPNAKSFQPSLLSKLPILSSLENFVFEIDHQPIAAWNSAKADSDQIFVAEICVDEERSRLKAPAVLIYAVAGIVGFCFMLMELVWFRMLTPLLGGTTFTFGIILAVALFGIGTGSLAYSFWFRRNKPTLGALSFTCALEGALLALPILLGDDLAIFTGYLLQGNEAGFVGAVRAWAIVCAIVVFPPAFISGVQFPLLIALLGEADEDLGSHIGWAYGLNTLGAIIGSLAGGFGLLPLISAVGAWKLTAVLLFATACAIEFECFRRRNFQWGRVVTPLAVALGIYFAIAPGPTAVWRHKGIGAGRSDMPSMRDSNRILSWKNGANRVLFWEKDGAEAGVAITDGFGYAFLVNGKSDGNAVGDAPTQIMLGVLGALLHPEPKSGLVIGLGTGESGGYLANVDNMERVDVVEIEPNIRYMAELCKDANLDVLNNPKVNLIYNDAREQLRTTSQTYDIIASEPSNPYRVGVSDLFTSDFYKIAKKRLNKNGIFVQWLQAYDIDETTFVTVMCTLRNSFEHVEVWQSLAGDLLLVCSDQAIEHNFERVTQRLQMPGFRRALIDGWRATEWQDVYGRFLVNSDLARQWFGKFALLNTDDFNQVEYGFARTLGAKTSFNATSIRMLAVKSGMDRPIAGIADELWERPEGARIDLYTAQDSVTAPCNYLSAAYLARANAAEAFTRRNKKQVIEYWEKQDRPPSSMTELAIVGISYAEEGNAKAEPIAEKLRPYSEIEAEFILGILRLNQRKFTESIEHLKNGFTRLQKHPYVMEAVVLRSLEATISLGMEYPLSRNEMLGVLEEHFSTHAFNIMRINAGILLAEQGDDVTLAKWLKKYEPYPIWERQALEKRARAYKNAKDPLAEKAQLDLQLYQSKESEAGRGSGK